MSKDLKGDDSVLGLSEVTENKSIWRMLVAEFLGTLILVFIGCGSVITLNGEPINIVQIALTFGFTVATVVQAICHISGGHINPAVTLSMFVTGDIKLVRAALYIVVQCVGAIAGAGLLKVIIPESRMGGFGCNTVNGLLTPLQGFICEAVLTFLLLLTVHAVCDGKRNDLKGSAPIAIGLAVAACHFSAIQYTGSSINPARSLGPAVIANIWENHWVYWAGPIVGGVLGGLVYKFVFKVRKDNGSYDF